MGELIDRDKLFVWHPFTQAQTAPEPLAVIKAKDSWLETEDGKQYLDLNSSWWTVLHGHGNTYISDRIKKQFDQLDHVVFAGTTHPSAVEIAERIVKHLPEPFHKVFFSDNGSTSVEVAIKMVYQRWFNRGISKKRFLALEGAYHGDTFGAMSVGQRGYFNEPFEHLFFDVDYIPFPTEENFAEVVNQCRALFETGECAGFIFEPLVQGAAGMRIYSPDHLNQLIRLAKEFDVMTIADEVMTGFYRTGKLFAINHLDDVPDVICLSKGLTGGVLPLGLTITSNDVYNSFLSDDTSKALLHGHSFTGNPISCAAACASLDLLEQSSTQDRIRRISEQQEMYVERNIDNPAYRSLKSLGTILSCELNVDESSGYFSSIRADAYQHFLDHGMLLRPLGNTLFINPPFCINEDELGRAHEVLESFVANKLK